MTVTDVATVGPSTGALALRSDQHQWSADQHAALAQLGVADAPAGDLAVFMHVSQRTGLDPFSRQIYMISRWDHQAGRNKWTIQTGIDGFRIIADRRPEYAGQIGPQWCGSDGQWLDFWPGSSPPVAARVGVLRRGWDQPAWGVAMFAEYCQTKKGGGLNAMWGGKGALMIAKCAEALALRKAFPNDLAGLLTPEEVDRDDASQRRVAASATTAPVTVAELTGGTPVPVEPTDPRPPGPSAAQNRQLNTLFRTAEATDRDDRLQLTGLLLGKPVDVSAGLTAADADTVIDALERLAAAGHADGLAGAVTDLMNTAALQVAEAELVAEQTAKGGTK